MLTHNNNNKYLIRAHNGLISVADTVKLILRIIFTLGTKIFISICSQS